MYRCGMTNKDKRVGAVRRGIATGDYTKYNDIYDLLPLTAIINLLGTNHKRLTKYNANPALFSLEEIFKIAEYLEVSEPKMIELIYNQVLENRKKKKRGK